MHPEAAQVLKDNTYMDDICDSVRSVQQAKGLTTQLDEVLLKGGFQVKGWLSNRSLEDKITEQDKPKMKFLRGASQEKILGTVWNHAEDVLLFNVNPPKNITFTKRAILSQIARIFHPVGLAAAFLVHAKIRMQRLWQQGLEWDQELPPPALENIELKRKLAPGNRRQCPLTYFVWSASNWMQKGAYIQASLIIILKPSMNF